jgi:hypothetical protein
VNKVKVNISSPMKVEKKPSMEKLEKAIKSAIEKTVYLFMAPNAANLNLPFLIFKASSFNINHESSAPTIPIENPAKAFQPHTKRMGEKKQ